MLIVLIAIATLFLILLFLKRISRDVNQLKPKGSSTNNELKTTEKEDPQDPILKKQTVVFKRQKKHQAKEDAKDPVEQSFERYKKNAAYDLDILEPVQGEDSLPEITPSKGIKEIKSSETGEVEIENLILQALESKSELTDDLRKSVRDYEASKA